MAEEPKFLDQLIGAQPGWDVLYYDYDAASYVAEPIVAWAILDCEGFLKAVPITSDSLFALDDERTIMAPDGSVRANDVEYWPNVVAWLDTMRNRKMADDERRTAVQRGLGSLSGKSAPVLALDNFRHRVPPHGDGS